MVDRIISPAAGDTIRISGVATLSSRSISGNGTVAIVDPKLVLTGPIELTTPTTLGIISNNNLGKDDPAAQLDQLARIIGGRVDAGGLHFEFTGDRTYYTGLYTTGDLKINGTARFAVYGLPGYGGILADIAARSIYALDGEGLITGKSRIAITGDIIVSDNLTVDNLGGLSLADAATSVATTIADGMSLIVGPNGKINLGATLATNTGAHLVLNPGAYKATGLVTINANTGAIGILGNPSSPLTIADGLTITPSVGDTTKVISLTPGPTPGTAPTFMAGGPAPVTLSGNGITIPSPGGSAVSFTVSGTPAPGMVTVKGGAQITLAGHATANLRGRLGLTDGAVLASEAATNPSYPAAHADYSTAAAFDSDGKLNADGTSNTSVVITSATADDAVFTSATHR
jgi:hypothetical protein